MERLCRDCPSLRSIAQSAGFKRAIEPSSVWHIILLSHFRIWLNGRDTEPSLDEQTCEDAGPRSEIGNRIASGDLCICNQQIDQRLWVCWPGTLVRFSLIGKVA